MSKSGFGQLYRRLSSKLLDLVVTPHVIGEVPGKSPAEEQELAEVNKKNYLLCPAKLFSQ